VVYVVAPFRIRFTFPDGHSVVRVAKAGDVLYSETVTHASENIGNTDAHGVLVELKTAGTRQAVLPAATPVASGDILTALTFIRGKPEKEADVKHELLSLTAPTRAEAGNLGYDLYQSADRLSQSLIRAAKGPGLDDGDHPLEAGAGGAGDGADSLSRCRVDPAAHSSEARLYIARQARKTSRKSSSA
jgi:hypothetical protein